MCSHSCQAAVDPAGRDHHPRVCRSAVRVLYGHDPDAATTGEGYVGMQTLAEVAGLAYTHPYSHLSLHSRFGPWFALRAVLVFDNVEYTGKHQPGCLAVGAWISSAPPCGQAALTAEMACISRLGRSAMRVWCQGYPALLHSAFM